MRAEICNPTQIRYLAPDAVVIADPNGADEISRTLAGFSERGIQIIAVQRQ